jgi:transcriptional regulator with XRE-family HTH domain
MSKLERFKMAAAMAKLNQREVAERCGIEPPALHGALTTALRPSKHLPAIAEVLGVDPDWLHSGDPAKAPPWAAALPTSPSQTPTAANPSESADILWREAQAWVNGEPAGPVMKRMGYGWLKETHATNSRKC